MGCRRFGWWFIRIEGCWGDEGGRDVMIVMIDESFSFLFLVLSFWVCLGYWVVGYLGRRDGWI